MDFKATCAEEVSNPLVLDSVIEVRFLQRMELFGVDGTPKSIPVFRGRSAASIAANMPRITAPQVRPLLGSF
jgi:hypothetical protein